MSLTLAGAEAILDGDAFPSTLYVQLHTGDPTDAGTANVSLLIPDRTSFTRNAASSGSATNDGDVVLTQAISGVSESILYVSFWDAATGGVCWVTTPLAAPYNLIGGATVRFLDTRLVIRFA